MPKKIRVKPVVFVPSARKGYSKAEIERQRLDAEFKAKREAENGETPNPKTEEKRSSDLTSKREIFEAIVECRKTSRRGRGNLAKKHNYRVKVSTWIPFWRGLTQISSTMWRKKKQFWTSSQVR